MDSQLTEYLGYPVFVWQAVLGAVGTLLVAITVGGFTTFYLRKKDEVTRVAGVILEKRINSAQEILMFFENASFKLEMKKEVSEPFYALLEEQDFKLPHGHHLQYARVFESVDKFRVFCLTFEQLISKHKLWLGEAVRFHLHLMQAYFSWINSSLLMLNHMPLPPNKSLTDEEFNIIAARLLLIQGIVLDDEFSGLIAHLEVLMTDAIYHLQLTRPKKSLLRNGLLNTDTLRVVDILTRETILGQQRKKFIALIIVIVSQLKSIVLDLDEVIDFFEAKEIGLHRGQSGGVEAGLRD